MVIDSIYGRLFGAAVGFIFNTACLNAQSDKTLEGDGLMAETMVPVVDAEVAIVDAKVPVIRTMDSETDDANIPIIPQRDADIDATASHMGPTDMMTKVDATNSMPPPCTRDFECNDNNPCTDDTCDNGECISTDNDSPCDDGVHCNGSEICSGGRCRLGALPCPSPDECDEDTKRCLACNSDEQCPAPEVRSSTPCSYEDPCIERGQQTQQILQYTCQDRVCVSETVVREARCERESDALPCGGGATCRNGVCPRDPLIKAISSGFVNFNARLVISCRDNETRCVVEGNRDRADRGSMNQSCEILCPAESQVEICCSNGSRPCLPGRVIAPIAAVSIDSLTADGLALSSCQELPDALNEARCRGIVGEVDAVVRCVFAR